MVINRLTLVLSAGQTIGGGITVSGNAGAVIRNLKESYYFTLIRVLGGDPLPPIGISVIEPCVQGRQKSNRLIGSIDSIV